LIGCKQASKIAKLITAISTRCSGIISIFKKSHHCKRKLSFNSFATHFQKLKLKVHPLLDVNGIFAGWNPASAAVPGGHDIATRRVGSKRFVVHNMPQQSSAYSAPNAAPPTHKVKSDE